MAELREQGVVLSPEDAPIETDAGGDEGGR